MRIRSAAPIPRFVHNSRRVLARIHSLAGLPTTLDLGPDHLHACQKLRLVVECGHHHMPPFSALPVIAVVANDEPLDGVVLRVNAGHRPALSCRIRHHWRQTGKVASAAI
jgi:hypothetical protein